MEYGNSLNGSGLVSAGGYSPNSVGASLSATPRPVSEFEREANRLSLCVEHAQKLVQDLAQRLAPILRPISELPKNPEKATSPQTPHGSFLNTQGNKVEQINDVLQQILNAIEV